VLTGAFLGFGNVAERGHLPGWRSRDDVRIVAATDAAPARRDAFLAARPDGRWYDTIDDLLTSETLDFVDICAPPGAHAALIRRALDAGLHVLCEKPLVTRAEEAETVALAAARAGRVVHTVHNWLKAPISLKISALIDEGAIGAVRSVEWRTLRARPATAVSPDGATNWRVDPAMAGGGILFDHGWHALYCVARWAGVPRRVSARLETRRFHDQPLLGDSLRRQSHISDLGRRRALQRNRDRRRSGADLPRRRCCRRQIEFAEAHLVVSSLALRRIAPSRLVRGRGRRLSDCGDRRRRQ
jgi:predicted dehydrogenase